MSQNVDHDVVARAMNRLVLASAPNRDPKMRRISFSNPQPRVEQLRSEFEPEPERPPTAPPDVSMSPNPPPEGEEVPTMSPPTEEGDVSSPSQEPSDDPTAPLAPTGMPSAQDIARQEELKKQIQEKMSGELNEWAHFLLDTGEGLTEYAGDAAKQKWLELSSALSYEEFRLSTRYIDPVVLIQDPEIRAQKGLHSPRQEYRFIRQYMRPSQWNLFPDAASARSVIVSANKRFSTESNVLVLIERLRANPNLQTLSLAGMNLKDWAIPGIKDALKSSQSIAYLNLSHNNLTGYSMTYLSSLFRSNHSLKTVVLTDAMKTKNPREAADASTIARAVGTSDSIEVFIWSENTVDLEAAKIFNTTVLADAPITGKPPLTVLDLSRGMMYYQSGVELAEGLKDNHSLRELILDGNLLDTFDRRKELIPSDHIGGIGEIANVLANHNSTLTHLSVGDMESVTGSASELGAMLGKNTTLTYLNVQGTTFYDEGLEEVLSADSGNVYLVELKIGSRESAIPGEKNVRIATKLADWSAYSTLSSIDLTQLAPGGRAIEWVFAGASVGSGLTRLNVSHTTFDSQAAVGIAKVLVGNVRLRHLRLAYNEIKQRNFVQFLATGLGANTALETLEYVGKDFIAEFEAASLAAAIWSHPSLTRLVLSADDTITRGVIKEPREPTRRMDIKGIRVLMTAIENNKTLEELELQLIDLDDLGGEAVARMIMTNKSVSLLNLYATGIGDFGVKAIARALAQNNTLLDISLSRVHHNTTSDSWQKLTTQLLARSVRERPGVNLDLYGETDTRVSEAI